MNLLKSNLGVMLAGSYALLMLVVLFFDFRSLDSDFWSWASVVLTLPWSLGVVGIGFLLIHISSYGMEYGFALGAMLNTIIFYAVGRLWSRRLAD
jgi:predicted RND superfamily exporter protein